MHVKIELNNTAIEEVNSAVIDELYLLAKRNVNGLDNSSNLVGRLHTTATYQEYINLLTLKFPDLYINADKYYIRFLDPVAQAAFSRVWGDGLGITMNQLNTIGDYLLGHAHWEPILNDQIVWLDEFKYTSVTSIWPGTFGASLYWINLLNVTSLYTGALSDKRNLCSKIMAHCDNLTVLEKAPFQHSYFENNTVIMPPNLTSFNSMVPSWVESLPLKIYFLNTTPPTFVKDLAFDACIMYVPTGCINVYKQAVIDAGYSDTSFITWLEYDWETDPDGWLDPVVIPDHL